MYANKKKTANNTNPLKICVIPPWNTRTGCETLIPYMSITTQSAQYYLSTSSDSEFVRLLTEQLTRTIHRKPTKKKKERETAKKTPRAVPKRCQKFANANGVGSEREKSGMASATTIRRVKKSGDVCAGPTLGEHIVLTRAVPTPTTTQLSSS